MIYQADWVNVWSGLIENFIINPHFFEDGDRYLQFLREASDHY